MNCMKNKSMNLNKNINDFLNYCQKVLIIHTGCLLEVFNQIN